MKSSSIASMSIFRLSDLSGVQSRTVSAFNYAEPDDINARTAAANDFGNNSTAIIGLLLRLNATLLDPSRNDNALLPLTGRDFKA